MLPAITEHWLNDPDTSHQIVSIRRIPPRPPQWIDFPASMHPGLKAALQAIQLPSLYIHQADAYEAAQAGKHIIITTGTASGKTIAFNLPVLQRAIEQPASRALVLLPTKALAQDQKLAWERIIEQLSPALRPGIGIYDGDTPSSQRSKLRDSSRILFSNPDMLHVGILPNHPRWQTFFQNLHYVIIDEAHIYRGIFGSQVANVLRRLKRVASFYGANPQFILTSATIANPVEHAQALTEHSCEWIWQDGSARGERTLLLVNPPVVNPELGIRRSALSQSLDFARQLLNYQTQVLLFVRTRRAVEMALTEVEPQLSSQPGLTVSGYRSGYLPQQRRKIEQGIKSGAVRLTIATNALELGIDIGGLDAVLCSGYPGTIAGFRQQIGRAGRGTNPSLAILTASASPLDQYLIRNPQYLIDQTPERALIDPNHAVLLYQHLRCALAELPFREGDMFGQLDSESVSQMLAVIAGNGEARQANGRSVWSGKESPAGQISLRSATSGRILIRSQGSVIGEVDPLAARWMVHPGAVYIHAGDIYQITSLDFENSHAEAIPGDPGYYTLPLSKTDITELQRLDQRPIRGGKVQFSSLLVSEEITGYRRIDWLTRYPLASYELDLPPHQLTTTGMSLVLDPSIEETLRAQDLWNSSQNNYGPDWPRLSRQIRERDSFVCRNCGAPETGRQHDVHHIQPLRAFLSLELANRPDNLITLCSACHKRAEQAVRVRTGLAGAGYVLANLAPLFLMTDREDLGYHTHPASPIGDGQPVIIIYDHAAGGIGLSKRLATIVEELLSAGCDLVAGCACEDGCPSCVGPGGEIGAGNKQAALAILRLLG